ncbi:conserved hypothetical protein [Ricinus communis]|uniref:Uncharacterized protein n=1 Tax=Ricinus communis TaxID=3988 RepID=B9SMD5_RICCO|nr:conserved hypothetical protein [Ricinus communis]
MIHGDSSGPASPAVMTSTPRSSSVLLILLTLGTKKNIRIALNFSNAGGSHSNEFSNFFTSMKVTATSVASVQMHTDADGSHFVDLSESMIAAVPLKSVPVNKLDADSDTEEYQGKKNLRHIY